MYLCTHSPVISNLYDFIFFCGTQDIGNQIVLVIIDFPNMDTYGANSQIFSFVFQEKESHNGGVTWGWVNDDRI